MGWKRAEYDDIPGTYVFDVVGRERIQPAMALNSAAMATTAAASCGMAGRMVALMAAFPKSSAGCGATFLGADALPAPVAFARRAP